MIGLAFSLAGIIILIGYVGDYLFRKSGIPDVLILIFFGLLLGPLFHIINPSVLEPISPIFVSLALMIILFDGGLNLNLHKVIQQSPKALLLAISGLLTSIGVTILFTHYVWNWDIYSGLLLGVIIGGSSSSVVISLISRIKIPERISTLLSLESTFTDAFVVVLSIALLQLFSGVYGKSVKVMQASLPTGYVGALMTSELLIELTTAFSTGIFLGVLVGIVWLTVLRRIKGEGYEDILTLSILLLFYSITQSLGGSGAIFALFFGLVLGNGKEILNFLKVKEPVEAGTAAKRFHSQISFFIRTFFFVYLGLILTLNDYSIAIFTFILSFLLLLGRFSTVSLLFIKDLYLRKNKGIISIMLPRGLAAAVIAQMALISGIEKASLISEVVIMVIISTVIISAIGTSIVSKIIEKDKEEKDKTH